MLMRFLRWFTGYLYVSIQGYSPGRFINLCSNNHILLWDLKTVKGGYECFISIKGYKQIRPIAKKTKTRAHIIERHGFPFVCNRFRKRKVFLLGFTLSIVLIYVMSLFLWNITIQGEYSHTKEELLKYLNNQNIHSGVLKHKINCRDIEDNIRKNYVDIGWVSAEMKGTRLIIKLKETTLKEKENINVTPHHIVALKDGIISSIVTREGTPQVKVGDVVKKGDILVSGIIDIVRDNTELLNRKIVASDADIIMKTVYNYEEEVMLNYIKKEYSGREKRGYGIGTNEHIINIYKPFKQFDKYDIIESENNLKLTENFYLPFILSKRTYKEYSEQEKTYTKEETIELLNNKLSLYIDKLMKKGVVVIENNVKIVLKDTSCLAKGKIIVEESAIGEQSIEDSEWRIIDIDEHN